MNRKDKDTDNRPKSRDLRPLRRLAGFLRPYRLTLVAAMAVLAVAAATVLAFGQVIRQVVDHGLASGSQAELNQALLLFLAVVVLMAISRGVCTW